MKRLIAAGSWAISLAIIVLAYLAAPAELDRRELIIIHAQYEAATARADLLRD